MNVILIDERFTRAKTGVDLSGYLGRGVVPDSSTPTYTTQAGTIDATAAVPETGVLLEAPTEDGGRVKVAIGGIIHGAVGGEAIPRGAPVVLGADGKWMTAVTAVAALSSGDPFFVSGFAHTACSGDEGTFAINLAHRYFAVTP